MSKVDVKVKELFTNFSLKDYETLGENSIVGDIATIRGTHVLIWGGGSRGRVAIGFLANQGIKPDYVIDLSPEKRNTYLLGIQIISPKDLVDCLDEKYEYIVAAATDFYLFGSVTTNG